MIKRVCVITTTRAEYGILYPLLRAIDKDKYLELQLVVSGTHLSKKYGNTIDEIINDGFNIDKKIQIITRAKQTTTQIFSSACIKFEKALKDLRSDVVILLGDRFEILAAANVCLFLQIPVVHIAGGDVTYGAIDDSCRHSITKIAKLHFAGNEAMAKRIIQMGENPKIVFNVGELGIENVLHFKQKKLTEMEKELNFKLDQSDFAIVTYHPVTTEPTKEKEQISALMEALSAFPKMKFIITKSNCDDGGEFINNYIQEFVKEHSNMLFISSLGRVRYFSLLRHAKMVIGNSSSGIIEVPYFNIPTVNIGNRQNGRMQPKSIYNCEPTQEKIIATIKKALNKITKIENEYLYGDGHTSKKIIDILKQNLDSKALLQPKKFYDIGERR